MLLEFKVGNFRSIRDEQVLSLIADRRDKTLPEAIIPCKGLGPGVPGVLRGAAIFGPNASGKSNLLAAAATAVTFVRESALGLAPGESTGAAAFKLADGHSGRPSEFEFVFRIDDTVYAYRLGITPDRVHSEELRAWPKRREQVWFARRLDVSSGNYVWEFPSTRFRRIQEHERSTRPNSSFLSVAGQLNHPQLLPVYSWFHRGIEFLDLSATHSLTPWYTALRLGHSAESRALLAKMLAAADLAVAGVEVLFRDTSTNEELTDLRPEHRDESGVPISGRVEVVTVKLSHGDGSGQAVDFGFPGEESRGTVRFFSLLGPVFDVLQRGKVLFVDELETSLHPNLVSNLLQVFLKPIVPQVKGQLIYATHNVQAMDPSFVRKDQVWFVEKNRSGASFLYPLSRFAERRPATRDREYLSGSYGAVPILQDIPTK